MVRKVTDQEIQRLRKKYEKTPEGPAKRRAFQSLDAAISRKMCEEAGLPPNFRFPVFMGSED